MSNIPKCILCLIFIIAVSAPISTCAQTNVEVWSRFEYSFTSIKDYGNPIYEIKKFTVRFTSPSGRIKNINGFWDDGRTWKVRFIPDERGTWSFESACSDTENPGLHLVKGGFTCTLNKNKPGIYSHGTITHTKGAYHLTHADGTPFFWAACTAWNGSLKSTDSEWESYLSNRVEKGFSIIQFVTTQWRGCEKNSKGDVAFEGSGKIKINPRFFRHLDKKIDKINEHGLVAAPVLLWALGTVQGRELSPGYYLPENEAVLLAKYMVARYGGNHVIWILGGDGKYTEENEQRWKNIGRGVFKEEHPGLVAMHPGGGSWIGEVYANETWVDIIGYQSGHNNHSSTLQFINKGPVASNWHKLPPRPLINMEPVYEEISDKVTANDVRNASYWSILSAPTAGITYGAQGIWPWLREGEVIINHAGKGEKASRWNQSLQLPGNRQVSYLSKFIQTLDWWNLRPAPQLLAEQPGNTEAALFIAVSQTIDGKNILLYVPKGDHVPLYNLNNLVYDVTIFDPISNTTRPGYGSTHNGILTINGRGKNEFVCLLRQKNSKSRTVGPR